MHGVFDDVTETPCTRMCPPSTCPNPPPGACFNESGFGTGARIVDVDLDGNNDIVKTDANPDGNSSTDDAELNIIYNNPANVGHFNVKQNLTGEPGFGELDKSYMFAAGDLNNNFGTDLYVVKTNRDSFLINECIDPITTPDKCDTGDGTVKFLSLQTVVGIKLQYPGGNVGLVRLNPEDNFPDATVADLDVAGSCVHELRIVQTTVNGPFDVSLRDAYCGNNQCPKCPWNTSGTYDFALLDVNGDGNPDLWSGHARGNQLFLWDTPSDCDNDGNSDQCDGPMGACCDGFTPQCIETFEACCSSPFDRFHPNETCATIFPCPTMLGPQPGG